MADNDQRSRSTDSGHGEATSTKSLIGRPAKSTATSSEDALIPPSSSESIATNTIDGKPSDGAGTTVFILCILAFVATALGLGGFLWRKHKQTQRLSTNTQRVGQESTEDGESKGLAGIFARKKKRPSPLPLSNLQNGNDPSLPPYTPFSAGATQSPWLNGNFTLQTAQPANKDVESQVDTEAKLNKTMNHLSKARRAAAERAGKPFSPFAPFSPVNAVPPADLEKGQGFDNSQGDNDNEEAAFPSGSRLTCKPTSSLHYSVNMPQPSPVRFMDPETAQAMGIHPDVIKTAEPGISEEEIERRRLRAQRRLEEQQRLDEGSIVEDTVDHRSHFSEIANDRRV